MPEKFQTCCCFFFFFFPSFSASSLPVSSSPIYKKEGVRRRESEWERSFKLTKPLEIPIRQPSPNPFNFERYCLKLQSLYRLILPSSLSSLHTHHPPSPTTTTPSTLQASKWGRVSSLNRANLLRTTENPPSRQGCAGFPVNSDRLMFPYLLLNMTPALTQLSLPRCPLLSHPRVLPVKPPSPLYPSNPSCHSPNFLLLHALMLLALQPF